MEISWEKAEPLFSAMDDSSPAVRLAALKALVRLPLSYQCWLEAAYRMLILLRDLSGSKAPSIPFLQDLPFQEIIEAAAFIPTKSVRGRLHELLKSEDVAIQKMAARALARAHDPQALTQLVAELSDPTPEARADAAEYLSLINVSASLEEVRETFHRETDGDTRFWLALALAQIGDSTWIEKILEEINQGTLELRSMWGDPEVLRKKLARGVPYPNPVREIFLRIAQSESADSRVRGIAEALYQAGYPPAVSQVEIHPSPPPNPELEKMASVLSERFQTQGKIDEEVAAKPLWLDVLPYLSQEIASRLVTELFKEAVRSEKLRTSIGSPGNEIVMAVASLGKTFNPDMEGLFAPYLELLQDTEDFMEHPLNHQIAWTISRAGEKSILDVLGPKLKSMDPQVRVAASKLIAQSVRYVHSQFPPIYGGVSEPADISPPQDSFIDDQEISEKRYVAMTPSREESPRVPPAEMPSASAPAPVKISKKPAPPKKRVVNTGFSPQTKPDTKLAQNTPLKTKEPYYFWFEIGRPQAGSIEVTPTDIPSVPAKSRLTVALFGFGDGLEITPAADTGELEVQEDGQVRVIRQPLGSCPPKSRRLKRRLFFPVRTPAKSGLYRMRCNIYRGQLLLQSRLIYASVAEHPAPVAAGEKPIRSILDYTLARTFHNAHLNRLVEHRLSILLNKNDDGTHAFHLFGLDGVEKFKQDNVRFKEGELEGMIDQARGTLRIASWGQAEEWRKDFSYRYKDRKPDPARLQSDLSNLARWGYEFYTMIRDRMAGGEATVPALERMLADPGYIQIAMKESPGYLLPASMIYDYPLDTGLDSFDLCSTFEEGFRRARPLEDLACFQGRCPSRNNLAVICPSGFWGFRHYLGMPLSVEKGPNIAEAIPFQKNLRMAVGVATDLRLLETHTEELKKLWPDLTWDYAENRDDVFKYLKGSPHVVYFYCHGGLLRDAPYLQVGSDKTLGRILPSNLDAYKIQWEKPRPLVFLNGCRTTAVKPLQALDFVSRFVARCHGSGVIGTEITIFEELATVFAEECFRRFFSGESIGQAIRGARLKLLSEGNPLGLVYIPFVMGGLKLIEET